MLFIFFNDTAPTEIYTLPLHDALPISAAVSAPARPSARNAGRGTGTMNSGGTRSFSSTSSHRDCARAGRRQQPAGSEEHTSELQSRQYTVCRLLLLKKKHGE